MNGVDLARPLGPLREAHAHVHQYGRSLRMIGLESCASGEDLVEAFAARALAHPGEDLLLGQGARPEAWDPPDWPSLTRFDRATGDRPSLAWCFDYHAVMANSAMLRLAGIEAGTPDPQGGIIGRDSAGRPDGRLFEAAALAAWGRVPEGGPEEIRGRLIEAVSGASGLASTFSEIHDLKSQRWLGPALRELVDAGLAGDAAFALYPLLEDLPEVLETRGAWECDRVRLGGAKIFVDGTLNSRTAWMLRPYADGRPDHPRGTPMMTQAEIEDAVRICDREGLPLAAHAIGDGAVRAVLDAVERVRPRTPGFRIEHAEVVDGADVGRFASLGVIASVQPCHLLYDIEALRRAIPGRLARVLPLRELIDAGCGPGELLLFGSDVPIVRPDPEDSVVAATLRRRGSMEAGEAIAPEQAITAAEAWGCFR